MSISGRIGKSRIRRPVMWWTAFAIAGATRMQPALPGDANRQCQATENPPTVNAHGAGAAGALVAALLPARQVEPLAHHVEQALARVDLQAVLAVIDRQMHCSGDAGELAVGDVHAFNRRAQLDD
jgi:hypothetical protein